MTFTKPRLYKKSLLDFLHYIYVPVIFFSITAPQYSYAIAIDSLFQAADERGRAVYTVTNTLDYRIYLAITFEEVEIIDGQKKVITTYTRDNIDKWKVKASPARIIIEPGFEKQFTVETLCGAHCQHDKEQIFRVKALPLPYYDTLEELNESYSGRTAFSIGFIAHFLNPIEDSPINLSANYSDGTIYLNNQGHSFVYVALNWCTPEQQTNNDSLCKKTRRVYSQQLSAFKFPDEVDPKLIKATAHTLNFTFRKDIKVGLN